MKHARCSFAYCQAVNMGAPKWVARLAREKEQNESQQLRVEAMQLDVPLRECLMHLGRFHKNAFQQALQLHSFVLYTCTAAHLAT